MVKLKTDKKTSGGRGMNKLEFFSLVLLLQTNCSVCDYVILYKNKYIIVHLTEVLVSYIPKFHVLQAALVHYWNFSNHYNVCSWLSMVVKKQTRYVFDIWRQRIES